MPQLAARLIRGLISLHYWFAECYLDWNRFSALWFVGNSAVNLCQISQCDRPLGLGITKMTLQSHAAPHSFWPQNNTVNDLNLRSIALLSRWATQATGWWTMRSRLLLRPGSPGAPRCRSPCRGTPSRGRPCASSASWCCCCSFSLFVASVSYWTPTAACPPPLGRTTRRDWTEDSLITRWCEDEFGDM